MPGAAPKVTVIIPTYNRAQFLGAAIHSVLQQDFQDFELLIVDDGSTDPTRQVVQSCADARLQYFTQEHKGVSAAVNHGIRCARGEFIARLDSDDIWLPEMLALGVATLAAQPEVGLVYGRAQGMTANGNLLNDFRGRPEWFPGEAFRSMLYGDFTCNITIMVRRLCFERAGWFDETLPLSEDWDMWLRVAEHYRFAFIDRIVARYRYHGDNITGTNSKHFAEHLDGRIKILDKVFARTDLPPAILQMKTMVYFNLHTFTGCCWLGQKKYRRAFECFGQAVRTRNRSALTFARIIWGVLAHRALAKVKWGRVLMDKVAQWGRRL